MIICTDLHCISIADVADIKMYDKETTEKADLNSYFTLTQQYMQCIMSFMGVQVFYLILCNFIVVINKE